eukprot:TRINITY_DN9809_c0_g1_i1.p1 TRINITY_DN9809_c0_g1~~TRINITY_DN9809_c0_g1_i1.p1  ORF type:complete len:894 (+),score=199.27 TRINITY_DN9809_c0_g1_i1:298-2682(+)
MSTLSGNRSQVVAPVDAAAREQARLAALERQAALLAASGGTRKLELPKPADGEEKFDTGGSKLAELLARAKLGPQHSVPPPPPPSPEPPAYADRRDYNPREPAMPAEGIMNVEQDPLYQAGGFKEVAEAREGSPAGGGGRMAQLLSQAAAQQESRRVPARPLPPQEQQEQVAPSPPAGRLSPEEKDRILAATIERQQRMMAEARGIKLDEIADAAELAKQRLLSRAEMEARMGTNMPSTSAADDYMASLKRSTQKLQQEQPTNHNPYADARLKGVDSRASEDYILGLAQQSQASQTDDRRLAPNPYEYARPERDSNVAEDYIDGLAAQPTMASAATSANPYEHAKVERGANVAEEYIAQINQESRQQASPPPSRTEYSPTLAYGEALSDQHQPAPDKDAVNPYAHAAAAALESKMSGLAEETAELRRIAEIDSRPTIASAISQRPKAMTYAERLALARSNKGVVGSQTNLAAPTAQSTPNGQGDEGSSYVAQLQELIEIQQAKLKAQAEEAKAAKAATKAAKAASAKAASAAQEKQAIAVPRTPAPATPLTGSEGIDETVTRTLDLLNEHVRGGAAVGLRAALAAARGALQKEVHGVSGAATGVTAAASTAAIPEARKPAAAAPPAPAATISTPVAAAEAAQTKAPVVPVERSTTTAEAQAMAQSDSVLWRANALLTRHVERPLKGNELSSLRAALVAALAEVDADMGNTVQQAPPTQAPASVRPPPSAFGVQDSKWVSETTDPALAATGARALALLTKHKGGVGWGRGRLRGQEADAMAEALSAVRDMLRAEL